VAIDPQASTGQTGIVVVGAAYRDKRWHGYVLEDATPPAGASPAMWGAAAVTAYHKHHADRIIGEVNNGGDMIEHVIRSIPEGKEVAYEVVRATRGKAIRAEPVAAVYEDGRGHHVGQFTDLEDELTNWIPGESNWSPNRLDALVWGYHAIVLGGVAETKVAMVGRR
jgi:phage terminase large subunit-like protein